jgi:AcrR family transcriptional regulator
MPADPPPPAPSAATTRDRLLDAAERLFAAHGVDGASLRSITSEAEANLAAVHYHFGSKLELVREVFQRRLGPMNAERMARLDEAIASASEGGPSLRSILHAFLAPALRLGRQEGHEFFVLIARAPASPHPGVQQVVADQFAEIAMRFGSALSGALPGVPREELFWRVHFIVGALCHTVVNTEILTAVSGGLCTQDDEEAVLDRLLDFAEAGLAQGGAR